MQLILGVKFDQESQYGWITATWIAMFIDNVPMALYLIAMQWILPDYWNYFALVIVGGIVVWFGTECENILTDPVQALVVCETLPF